MKKFLALLLLCSPAFAAPEDMVVYSWGPDGKPCVNCGCDVTTTTNWFYLDKGESVTFSINLTACPAENLGVALFFGYDAQKNKAPQLSKKSGMELIAVNDATGESVTNDSYALVQTDSPTTLTLTATKIRGKDIKLRLRVQAIAQ